MDLNHLLLFVAFISPLILIARSQRHATANRGWRVAAVVVFLTAGAAWFLFPAGAGYIAGVAWLGLLLIPALSVRQIASRMLCQRFTSARRLARFLTFLHPADGIPQQAQLLRGLELAQLGQTQTALTQLAMLRSDATPAGRQATIQTFVVLGDWNGLIAWCRSRALRPVFELDPAILTPYFRALGETHRIDDLAHEIAARVQTISVEPSLSDRATQFSLLMLAAFCGRKILLVRLINGPLRRLSDEMKSFWIGTSEIAAGDLTTGCARLDQLQLVTKDALLRCWIEHRLRVANDYARAAAPFSEGRERILRRLEKIRWNTPSPSVTQVRTAPAVFTLITLNIAMFALETILGGSENPFVLHRLGQLETAVFFTSHEYWRLFTALFLHYGVLHLLFNVYALFVLGPTLERSIGTFRFIVCYLLSGIGASLGVVAFHAIGLTPAEELVGASGAIMGLVGAWAGLLLKNQHSPLAGRRLQSILIIVVLQTLFDFWTPQVSMVAHMSGLLSGLILGLILGARGARV